MKIYTGIGSRETPSFILEQMRGLATIMALNDWTLRSGFADGADNAFAKGADQVDGKMEIYIPWKGFNNAPNHPAIIVPKFTKELMDIAKHFHPNWNACSEGAKKLHARNVPQVIGLDLNLGSDLVICWTPNGKGGGGTGQAIRIANHLGIPVFDWGKGNSEIDKTMDYIFKIDKEYQHASN